MTVNSASWSVDNADWSVTNVNWSIGNANWYVGNVKWYGKTKMFYEDQTVLKDFDAITDNPSPLLKCSLIVALSFSYLWHYGYFSICVSSSRLEYFNT
jgi:hypothetical protein